MSHKLFDYILQEEESWKTKGIDLDDNWHWHMFEHIRKSFLFKNSKFYKAKNDDTQPFKNITRPILNVHYRATDFDVTDVVPYVTERKNYHKSFIVKKYHPKWARDNDIDTFFDELNESYHDYGLALVKDVNGVRPEVVPLQRLAFCDQTDILSGPVCEKHYFTSDQLLEQNWDKDKIEEAIEMAEAKRELARNSKSKTPGKYIEVYELRGVLPTEFLDEDKQNDKKFTNQVHFVTYFKDQKEQKNGIHLFNAKDNKERYKAIKRDPIHGRACGLGAVEELFDPQLWTNYSELQIKEMLDAAATVIWQTADKTLAERNRNIGEIEKNEIITYEDGKPLSPTRPDISNKQQFDENVERWGQMARNLGSADEALLGEQPPSGTPFRLQSLVTQQGLGLHEHRQGKIATFVGQVYRDWILKYLVNKINEGQEFLEELSLDETEWLANRVLTRLSNKRLKELVFKKGKIVTEEERDLFKQVKKRELTKDTEKRFIKAIKNELKDIPMDVEINVSGKQKDLTDRADKLTNIFRQIVQSPQMLQMPGFAQLFNQIIESSGLDPVDFNKLTAPQPSPQQQQQNQPQQGGQQPTPSPIGGRQLEENNV